MTYDEYSDAVCTKVEKMIAGRSWFKGVCTDTIKESYRLDKTVEDAAETAVMDTAYYDAPSFMTGQA